MKFFRRFKRFSHIPINDMNELYGAVHAAYDRLERVKVCDSHLKHAVEKVEVLNLLKTAKEITDKWI